MNKLKLVLPLLFLAFIAGFAAARLWPTEDALPAVAPSTATPVPPTPVISATPTPTTPELGDPLETLYIEIAPDDFALIESKRAEALERWILQASSADFVPATLRLGHGAPIPARLRLKGDWADHFAHEKWSYRIETRGEAYLFGMKVFSIQDPSTRTYLNEWLFLETLRVESVLGVHYTFVQVVQNGEPMGVYAVEEGFAKELLESQQRREGVIIRYNEDLLWEYWAAYENDQITPRGVNEFHIIDEFESGKVAASPALSAQREAAIGQLRAWENGDLTASEVFDSEALAKFLALSDLWGAKHALYWHNLRFYYNPVTTRLEPIAFDAQPLESGAQMDWASLSGLNAVLDYADPALHRAYVQYLWQYSQPGYLDALRARYEAQFETLRAALAPEFGDRQHADGTPVLAPPWDALAARQTSLREALAPLQMTYAFVPGETPPGSALWVNVGNLLDFPVQILGVQAGATWLPANRAWPWPTDDAPILKFTDTDNALVLQPLPRDAAAMPYAWLTVLLPFTDTAALPPLTLHTQIWGLTQTVTQPIAINYPAITAGSLPPAPSRTSAFVQHPYLTQMPGEDLMLTLRPGTRDISGSLVLPASYGLRLEAGTTLRFAPDAFLLARGPLIFEGTEDAPVTLQPTGETWRGVIVLEAGAPSFWQHTIVENTDAVALPGWTLTGGITFYRSPLRLDHSHLLGTRAEDLINVIRAPFEFVDSEFAHTASDAFDADFGEGRIERCTFHDIGADAIDVSGTPIEVYDVHLQNLGDKGLSVGEGSTMTAARVVVTNADYGAASKDRSHLTVSDLTLEGVRIAGLAAYIKKPAYGPATLTATGVTFGDLPAEQHFLVQTGCWIDLDGVRTWGTNVDVDALYEKWVK